MSDFTRRAVLAGIATSTASSPIAAVLPARAAAPLSRKQLAGWYRYKLGDFEITVVTDGASRFPLPDSLVTNATREEVSAALTAAFMEKDMVTVPYTPIVVNTGTRLVVIDTGWGEATYTQSNGASGQFHTNLAASGIDVASVDTVIISHYHADHVNGLVTAKGQPAFPAAEILVPAAEHRFWMDDGEMSRAPAGRMEEVFENNRRVFAGEILARVKTYEPGKEIVPGITSVATNGHTPGHNSHIIVSGSSKLYVQADITNVPFLFARHPAWHIMFDQDGKMAEATRRRVYEMLAAEKMPVQGFHYPFPALAHIEKSGSGYREIPVPWNPVI